MKTIALFATVLVASLFLTTGCKTNESSTTTAAGCDGSCCKDAATCTKCCGDAAGCAKCCKKS